MEEETELGDFAAEVVSVVAGSDYGFFLVPDHHDCLTPNTALSNLTYINPYSYRPEILTIAQSSGCTSLGRYGACISSCILVAVDD
jgi:hypothetical protein